MVLTEEQKEYREKYNYIPISDEQFVLLFNKAQKQMNLQEMLPKYLMNYLEKIMNSQILLNYIHSLHLKVELPEEQIVAKLESFFQLLQDCKYILNEDDVTALLDLPVIEKIFEKISTEENFLNTGEFKKDNNYIMLMDAYNSLFNTSKVENYDENLIGTFTTNSANDYIKEICKYSVLTPEQVIDLCKKIEKGDLDAKQELIKHNLRLVASVASRFAKKDNLPDLIQEGNIGLMKAVEKFDYRKNYKFSTYATWWIKQSITRSIANQERTIRLPVHALETLNKILAIQAKLTLELHREPTVEEIAKKANLSVKTIKGLLKYRLEPVSLEAPIGENEDTPIADLIADTKSEEPEQAFIKNQVKRDLEDALSVLTQRERFVIEQRVGWEDNTPKTLEEIGQIMGVTRERVRQIEKKALKKLRQPYNSWKINNYLSEANNEDYIHKQMIPQRKSEKNNFEMDLFDLIDKYNIVNKKNINKKVWDLLISSLNDIQKKIIYKKHGMNLSENYLLPKEDNQLYQLTINNLKRDFDRNFGTLPNNITLNQNEFNLLTFLFTRKDTNIVYEDIAKNIKINIKKLGTVKRNAILKIRAAFLYNALDEEEGLILMYYFAIGKRNLKSIKEIANILNRSEEEIYKIGQNALMKLYALSNTTIKEAEKDDNLLLDLKKTYPNVSSTEFKKIVESLSMNQKKAIYLIHGKNLDQNNTFYLEDATCTLKEKTQFLESYYQGLTAIKKRLIEKNIDNSKYLTNEEYEILCLAFGINKDRIWNNNEIATKLNLTLNQVVYIKKKAIKKLLNDETIWYKKNSNIEDLKKIIAIENEKVPKLFLLMKKHPELTLEAWKTKIKELPEIYQQILYLRHGESLKEILKWPTMKSGTYYYNIYLRAIKNLEKTLQNQEDLTLFKVKEDLKTDKINLLKAELYNKFTNQIRILPHEILIEILNQFLVNLNCSKEEYEKLVENKILEYLKTRYKKSQNRLEKQEILEEVNYYFIGPFLEKWPTLTVDEIKYKIKECFETDSDNKDFQENLLLRLHIRGTR